jgi:ribosomal protein L12E/L44/L45/RPP1/RPP2
VAVVVGAAAPASAQASRAATSPNEQRARYQMGTMESVLERAVEHAAAVTRGRLQSMIPADMLLSENARVRGFRLEGWGVFFDVVVPTLEGTLPWSFMTLSRNNLGLDSALATLRSQVEKLNDASLREALQRVELQVGPVASPVPTAQTAAAGGGAATGPAAAQDRILDDPENAYRQEVISAVQDAMLDFSRGLDLGEDEWLSVGARRDEGRRLTTSGTEARTIQIRIGGRDLQAFLTGRASREEALARMEVRVF